MASVTKSEPDGRHPASHYLVVEDAEQPSTWHLRVRDANGALNHTLMGAAWAALHDGYRGKKYKGPGKEAAIVKLKVFYKSEGMDLPTESGSDVLGSSFLVGGQEPQTTKHEGRHLAVLLNGPGRPMPQTEDRGLRFEVPVCVAGSWVKEGHQLSITVDDLEVMVRNFEKRKNDQVVIDYEHASEHPEISRGGPVPAAGWIHELRIGSSGDRGIGRSDDSMTRSTDGQILLALVEWTPEAERMIRGGQYRFFSPAIDWNYKDKSTGEPQGTTLTSGALTNHPFLEELPPIMLTDPGFGIQYSGFMAADTLTGYLDAPLKTVCVAYGQRTTESPKATQGAKMAESKRLSIKRITGDDFEGAQGHHGIFDGDNFVGHVHADDMKDYVKSCMDDGFGDLDDLMDDYGAKGQAGVKGHQQAEMSELLRESGVKSLGSGVRDQMRAALKLAATHQLVEQREAARALLLSECLRPLADARGSESGPEPRALASGGWFDTNKAKALLCNGKITASDLLDAIEAKDTLNEAVAQGKVLPKDRAFFFEIAMNNPKKFTEYIAGAVPAIQFGSVGLGSTEKLPVDQEVDIETKKLMSEKKLSYGKAMKELFRSNPALEDRYRAAHRQEPGTRGQGPGVGDGTAAGITQ